MHTVLIVALLTLLAFGGWVLCLDTRQKRVDQRLANAIKASPTTATLSVRLQKTEASFIANAVRFLFGYEAGSTLYRWPVSVVTALGVAGALLTTTGSSFVGFSSSTNMLAGLVVGCLVIRGLFSWQRSQTVNLLFQQLPDALALITSVVRAGLPVTDAFRTVASEMPLPTSKQFSMVCSDIALGRASDEAVGNVFLRTQLEEYGMFAVSLGIQMKAGGRLTETLQTLGNTVRQRVAMAGRAKALAGEVTFSAKALALAPFGIGGILYMSNPESVQVLFTDPRGRLLLAYAAVSIVCGMFAMRWLIRRETTI